MMGDEERTAAERAMEHIEPFDEPQAELLWSTLRLRPGESATEEEVERLLDWARQVYVDRVFIDLLLLGEVAVVGFDRGHPRFVTAAEADGRDAVDVVRRILGGEA